MNILNGLLQFERQNKYHFYNIHWQIRILWIFRVVIYTHKEFKQVCIRGEISWGW